MHSAYYTLLNDGIPTKEELLRLFEEKIKPKPKAPSIYQYTLQLIERRKTNYKPESIKIYKRCASLIKEFDEGARFEDVDMDWLDRFRDYLLNKVGYQQNTAAKAMSTLRTVLNDAADYGVNTSTRYKTRKVSIPKVWTTKIFLDESELMRWYYAKMPNKQKELARDLFLISAFTGVRYNDIWAINRSSFTQGDGIHYFNLMPQKTGKSSRETVQIPAHPVVLEIMEKYDWHLPHLSNQKFNTHLKEIGAIAGINQSIVQTTYPKGKRLDRLVPKYLLITAHTGRRSLICNLYIAGIPVETIKKISGHRTHDAFMAYMRLTPQDHLKVAFKSEFFTKRDIDQEQAFR